MQAVAKKGQNTKVIIATAAAIAAAIGGGVWAAVSNSAMPMLIPLGVLLVGFLFSDGVLEKLRNPPDVLEAHLEEERRKAEEKERRRRKLEAMMKERENEDDDDDWLSKMWDDDDVFTSPSFSYLGCNSYNVWED